MLWLLFSVQVIEVAEKFIEPVSGRQKFIAIPEMILAILAGHIPFVFENGSQGHIFRTDSQVSARGTHLGKPRTNWRLTRDER